MDHISIIIVHYNTDKETKACLESLAKIKSPHFRHSIIVLDNASKEPLKLPAALEDNGIDLLRSEANLGFTGGNNLAIAHAIEQYQSDYVLVLNNDTLVDPDFLTHLHQMLKTQPELGMVCPKIYFAKGYEFHKRSYSPAQKGQILWYAGGSIDWRNLMAFHRGIDEFDRGQFDTQTESDFATGCCILIAREVVETVGGFDDRYFLYMEDVDLSWRARLAGYQIGFCPASIVWHKNAGSTGGPGSRLHQYYQTRNRLWFAWRYGQWRTWITAAGLAVRTLWSGTYAERIAIRDVVTGQLGKKPIL